MAGGRSAPSRSCKICSCPRIGAKIPRARNKAFASTHLPDWPLLSTMPEGKFPISLGVLACYPAFRINQLCLSRQASRLRDHVEERAGDATPARTLRALRRSHRRRGHERKDRHRRSRRSWHNGIRGRAKGRLQRQARNRAAMRASRYPSVMRRLAKLVSTPSRPAIGWLTPEASMRFSPSAI